MKWHAFTVICLLGCMLVSGSNAQFIGEYRFSKMDDSLINRLQEFPQQDTNRLNTLTKLLNSQGLIFLSERKKKMPFWLEAYQLSKRLNQPEIIAYCYYWIAGYYKSCLQANTSLLYLDSCIQTCNTYKGKPGKYERIMALGNQAKAVIYSEKENYLLALKYHLASLEYFDGKPEPTTFTILQDIADIYSELGNNGEELHTYKKMEKLHLENAGNTGSASNIDGVYMPMSNFFIRSNDIKTAKIYLRKAGANMPDSSDPDFTAAYYRHWGDIYLSEKKYDSARYFSGIALGYAYMAKHGFNKKYIYKLLSATESEKGNYKTAETLADSSLKYALIDGDKGFAAEVYKMLSACKFRLGKNKEAYELLTIASSIEDSCNFKKDKKSIANLAAFYESSQKETRILELEKKQLQQTAEIEKKAFVNKLLIGGPVVLMALGFLMYRNFRHRQKLQQQKITELETEQQLQAVDAMLKGQEEERSRIAKDLHDGLGGLLSATKMSFMNTKENMVLSADQVASFENSLKQLDSSIAELRKVAHNLMPEALIKFGLKKALIDYCNSLSAAWGHKINFEALGTERELENTANLFTYRIVQELVNNAVKYANATQVLVQLTKTSGQVLLTVEDDGKGFDKTALNTSDGIGYKSIKQRIDYFRGKLQIDTSPGNGTSVNIELYA